MDEIRAMMDRAVASHQSGRLAEALAIYRQVIEVDPDNAGAWHLAGVIEHQSGNHEAALEKIARAILLDGTQAVFFNNYGAALQALGRFIEALGLFQRAALLKPRYVDAHSNLGNMLEKLGHLPAAEASLRTAHELDARHFDTLRRLGNLLVRRGRREEAVPYLQNALELQPDNGELLAELGNCWLSDSKPQEAVKLYREALLRAPHHAAVHFNLGSALADQDLLDEAEEEFRTAARLAPHRKGWPFRPLIMCPTAFPSAEALDEWRARLEQRIDDLLADPPDKVPTSELMSIGFYPPFGLGFQGRANRQLKEKFAALVRHWVGPQPDPVGSGGKPRIGFVVTRGHEGAFIRGTAGIVRGLDPGKFDLVILCPDSSVQWLQPAVAGKEVRFITFPENLVAARTRIEEARCDVLYYWEIGTDSLNYLLPFFRLAPIQFTAWGTQVTSGVKEVDYYVSSHLIETPQADAHYAERLWRLRGLPTWQRRLPMPPKTAKSYFGLDPGRPFYLCAQTVLKFHPEQDAVFAEVLRKDPRGILALKQGRHSRPAEMVRERMQKTMADVFDRVVFLPWQSHEDYARLVATADVVLDTIHFSAGSSSYDMWSYNQPLVTLPGEFNVGRYTLACYRRIELLDVVARSPAHYAELAARMGNDQDFSRQVRQRLAERAPVLFEDPFVVQEHSEILLQMYEEGRARR